jgi:hypothetical protein
MKRVLRADAIAIAALVAVNLVARLAVRIADPGSNAEFIVGLASLGAMAVLAAAFAFVWMKRHETSRVVQDSIVVVTITSVLVTLVGPFVFGRTLGDFDGFSAWFAFFLLQLFICLAVLAVGAVIGSILAIAFGLDPTTRAWRAQAGRDRAAKKAKAKAAGKSGAKPAAKSAQKAAPKKRQAGARK